MSIALLAAFADGAKAQAERTEIRRIAEMLAHDAGAAHLAGVYQKVLLKRVDVATAAAGLEAPEQRQLAYEIAVCVCDADGQLSNAETQFLADLRQQLGLEPAQTAAFDQQADTALAALDETASATAGPPAPVMAPPRPPAPEQQHAPQPAVAADEAALDRSILNYAILNGALELLPQSWASMAIIPLQIRMVYGVGKTYGVTLDQGHVREFIAAAGVGLTSQYLEQFGRKLLGGLFGSLGGKAGRGIGRAGASMAMSFATTYALGQLARRYYAGGRVMSTALLRETYQGLLEPAQQMQTRFLPQIRQKASTLDAAQVMAIVRGG